MLKLMELIDKNFKIIFKSIYIHTHVYRGMEITDESMENFTREWESIKTKSNGHFRTDKTIT